MSVTAITDSRADRDTLITENMGLVHTCAHRFTGKGIEYEDLFQAGCMGLVKAFDAFDRERGVRFSTSRTLKELSMKTAREREKFAFKEGREPTIKELAERLGVSEEEVTEAVCAAAPVVSLTTDEDSGGGQSDIPVESPEEQIAERLSVIQAVSGLEERDRAIVRLRYYENKTQTQTAAALGMTQVQVSRREKKILCLLRQELSG